MTKNQESKDIPPMFKDEETVKWMDEHLTELKQTASGQRLVYTSLIVCFVAGLVAQAAGYALLLSTPGGFLGLLADLLHALGWSLWTGVVVVVFIEIFPEMKRRQIQQAVDAYESLKRERSNARENSG
jgi:putative copper export protein